MQKTGEAQSVVQARAELLELGGGSWAYGASLSYRGHDKTFTALNERTSSQELSLEVAVKLLSSLKRPCRVSFLSSSIQPPERRWLERAATTLRMGKSATELIGLLRTHEVKWGNPHEEDEQKCLGLAAEAATQGQHLLSFLETGDENALQKFLGQQPTASSAETADKSANKSQYALFGSTLSEQDKETETLCTESSSL